MDHPLDENVVEPDKYAFLLGCSLRDNNLEQFFSVYDAILPKHLSESQLDKIKERARQISELPQDKFDELVLRARDYSLAQGRGRTRSLDMSGLDRSSSTRGPGVEDWNSGSDDEEDGTAGRCRTWGDNFTLLSQGSRYGEDRDSGLPSSGKGAGSWCENDVSDSEDRGVIHYFPSYESTKKTDAVKISETDNPDFDEIHDVESDKSSIESPRSDASSTNEYNVTNPDDGFEMKTINREEIPRFQGINIHRQLYNRPYRSDIPYSQLRNDCDNDEEISYGNSYQQRQHLGYGRNVDEKVYFPIHNKDYHFSKSLEEAESGGFQKHDSFYSSPFGNKNPLKVVGDSINNLIGPGSSVVTNMPHGADIQDEARKKKNMKKKKGSKDDGDDRVSNSKTRKSFMNQDENGNPIDLSAYRQMREIPNKTEGSARKQPNYGTYNHHGPFASDTTNFDSNFQFHGQQVKDLEDGPSNTDRKKLRKKTHKEPVKFAQDIPNYVGDIDSVDDLVKFIETGEKQVKKKVSQKTSPSSEPSAKADKVIKRKEKKVKVGQTDDTGVPVSDCGERLLSPTPSAGEAGVTSPVPVPASPPVVSPTLVADSIECLEEDMGNSGDKSAAVTSVADSQSTPESEDKLSLQSESPVVPIKDCDPPVGRISSSKSPPLHKREIEHKEKNKSKAKEKEKEKSPEAAVSAEAKKQKGKNGKTDLQVKNNKKVETRNDIINNTKSVEKMKIESNGPITVVSHLDRDDLGIVDNHQDYIFTDIDNLPPVEQEFTLVSKKKKRQGAKDIVAEIPRQKNGPREYRGLPAPRSVTPPPPSLLKKEQSRDLSPSSFPALGKKASISKARPTFREGRRNSFGDVPIDTLTELRSQDDSDIESVKSLPAAKGGSLGDVVSSRFPVSYAKMAAAPKPPNSPTSPKTEEEEDEERGEEEDASAQSDSVSSRKPTIWKGSPTERRHSIGSSPEDTKQENSPKFTQRSRQKSGSQEFLLNVECAKSDVDVSVPDSVEMQSRSVSVDEVNIVSSSSSSEITVSEDPGLTPIPGSKELSPETQFSPSTDSQPIPTITVTLDSNKSASVVKNNNQNGPKVVGPQGAKSPDMNSTSAVPRAQPPASSSSSSKDSSRSKAVPGRVANNSRKNNKSVIFLDKRFSDEPENIGITFGFDSNFGNDDGSMCKVEPVNTNVNEIQLEVASCNRKEPTIHNQMEAQSVPVTLPPESLPKDEPTSVAPPASATGSGSGSTSGGSPAASTAGVVVRGGAPTVALPGSLPPPPATTSTSNKPSSKTRVGGLNGVVVPKTQGYRNRPASEALRTERVAMSSSESRGATAAAPSASLAASASNKKDNNKTVLVFYGDGIKAKIGNSDVTIDSRDKDPPSSSQHKGQLSFSQDTNHRGKFNVNEAARFLKQEWERVMEQQEKNPQAVVFYNGQ